MSEAQIKLDFVSGPEIQLFGIYFQRTLVSELRHTVRGKTAGAYGNAGTFQWTSAVKGMCALLVRHALNVQDPLVLPRIDGGKTSIACSLDYALSKGPSWLVEMYGVDATGEPVAKRLFKRSNPNLKRAGPVVVAVNGYMLNGADVGLKLDGKVVTSNEELRKILQSLELVSNADRGHAIAVEVENLLAVR